MPLLMILSNFFYVVYFVLAIFLAFYVVSNKNKEKDNPRMIKCPDCGKKISINAKTCRYCNSEILQNKKVANESIENNYKKNNYLKRKYSIIIYQLIAGLAIVYVYERVNDVLPQVLVLLSLIINTMSIIIFMFKSSSIRKELKKRFSVLSVLAVFCGLFFSVLYSYALYNNINLGYENDLREILYLGDYDKEEAKEFLNNIYSALNKDEKLNVGFCLSLYDIWKDRDKENTYVININETCTSSNLPANATKVEVYDNDKTKIKKIYWDFNDNIDIVLYDDGKQVKDFKYLYSAMLYTDMPAQEIKERFENDVKERLKSPSSAVFTYNDFNYLKNENRFYYDGWVEGQNSFGAMVKEDFILKLIPCNNNYCDYYSLDYKWNFN